jgi:hypothetical protein
MRFATFLVVLAVAGCSGQAASVPLPKTVPASGTVTLNGATLASAVVTFIPRQAESGIECTGMTDDAGLFKLKQLRGGEGAPPGEYTVVISRLVKPDGTPVPPNSPEPPADLGAVESLPARYSNPAESKLTANVPAQGGEFKFDLTSP